MRGRDLFIACALLVAGVFMGYAIGKDAKASDDCYQVEVLNRHEP